MKKVLHLLSAGGAGGIELLCEQIGLLGKEQHEFCFLFGMGEIAGRMKEEGLKTHDLSSCSRFLKLKALAFLVRENGYDAVVVHHEGVGTYFLYRWLHKLCKKPEYIKYLHCSFEDKFFYTGNALKDKLHYKLLSKVLKESDKLIAVSEFTKKSYITEFGIPEDKIKVVYNGIPADQLSAVDSEGAFDKDTDNIGLLYIGRLVDVKGVNVLIDAIALLVGEKSREGSIHLDILGDGPARQQLEAQVKALGIPDIVTFHGVQLNKAPFYAKDSIFVYPPVWQEAFGISIIEAMAQGLICVASDVGGIPEIITNEKQGILFKAGDPEALSHALSDAIARVRSGNVSEFRKESVNRAGVFTIEKSIEGLEKI